MSYLQAIVLGVVQGVTEFLPVSSSGHLILVPHVFGWPDQGQAFDAVMHIGTLAALVAYFRVELMELVTGALSRQVALILIAATIPGGLGRLQAPSVDEDRDAVRRSRPVDRGRDRGVPERMARGVVPGGLLAPPLADPVRDLPPAARRRDPLRDPLARPGLSAASRPPHRSIRRAARPRGARSPPFRSRPR